MVKRVDYPEESYLVHLRRHLFSCCWVAGRGCYRCLSLEMVSCGVQFFDSIIELLSSCSIHYWQWGALVCWDCHNKSHRLGGSHNRNVLSHIILQATSLRSRCWKIWFLGRKGGPLFLPWRWLLIAMSFTCFFLCTG